MIQENQYEFIDKRYIRKHSLLVDPSRILQENALKLLTHWRRVGFQFKRYIEKGTLHNAIYDNLKVQPKKGKKITYVDDIEDSEEGEEEVEEGLDSEVNDARKSKRRPKLTMDSLATPNPKSTSKSKTGPNQSTKPKPKLSSKAKGKQKAVSESESDSESVDPMNDKSAVAPPSVVSLVSTTTSDEDEQPTATPISKKRKAAAVLLAPAKKSKTIATSLPVDDEVTATKPTKHVAPKKAQEKVATVVQAPVKNSKTKPILLPVHNETGTGAQAAKPIGMKQVKFASSPPEEESVDAIAAHDEFSSISTPTPVTPRATRSMTGASPVKQTEVPRPKPRVVTKSKVILAPVDIGETMRRTSQRTLKLASEVKAAGAKRKH